MLAKYTVTAAHVRMMVDFGVQQGLDRATLLAVAGYGPDHVFDPDEMVTLEQSGPIWAYLLHTLQDPALGIRIAETCTTEDFHALGFAVMACRNVREGIARAARYFNLITNSGSFQLLETPTLAALIWNRDLPHVPGIETGNESAIAQFLQCCRIATGTRLVPNLVTFRHAAPPSTDVHEAFFGCRVVFGGESDSLSCHPEVLDQPLEGADEARAAFFGQYLRSRYAGPKPSRPLVDKVRESILGELSDGVPTSEQVARQLGLSNRSLRRHLRREGLSYRNLVRGVRLQAARALLQRPENTISDVAFLLGYSDAGAFSRAFRRSTGVSPKEFRATCP